MLLVGALFGLGLALAFLYVRARHWAVVRPLGQMSLVLLLVLGALGVVAMVFAGRGGGDAVIAAMTGLVVLVMGIALICGAMMIVGAIQGGALKLPIWPTSLSVIPEVILLGLIIGAYHSSVAAPAARTVTDEWLKREIVYRNQRKNRNAVPAQYQGITSQMLNEHARIQSEMAKLGQSVPPLVPRDVENTIRNAELESMQPGPIPDRARSEQIRDDENRFRKGSAGGWLIGALVCPWIIRKRVLPPWHSSEAPPTA